MQSNGSIIFPLHITAVFLMCNVVTGTRVPVSLDILMPSSNEFIDRMVINEYKILFSIKDRQKWWIGDVYHTDLLVMKDAAIGSDGPAERTVYFNSKIGKEDLRQIVMIITTGYDREEYTEEYIIHILGSNKHVEKVRREPVLLDIQQDYGRNDHIKVYTPVSHWKGFKIKDESFVDKRIGDVVDAGLPIVIDPPNSGIRLRFVHKLRLSFLYEKLRKAQCLTGEKMLNVVRVYTYYWVGQRTFDEFIELRGANGRSYVENRRIPVELQFENVNKCRFIKKRRRGDDVDEYKISDTFQLSMRLGRIANGTKVIIEDDPSIRIRIVEVDSFSRNFMNVVVNTWYRVGECDVDHFHLVGDVYVKDQQKELQEQKDLQVSHALEPAVSTTSIVQPEDVANILQQMDMLLNRSASDLGLETTGPSGSILKQAVETVISKGVQHLIGGAPDEHVTRCVVVVDISKTVQSPQILVETLPRHKSIFMSVKQEHMQKPITLEVVASEHHIASVDLLSAVEMFMIINYTRGYKRLTLIVHKDNAHEEFHETFIVEGEKGTVDYQKKEVVMDEFFI